VFFSCLYNVLSFSSLSLFLWFDVFYFLIFSDMEQLITEELRNSRPDAYAEASLHCVLGDGYAFLFIFCRSHIRLDTALTRSP
jgi:hypothetical protein